MLNIYFSQIALRIDVRYNLPTPVNSQRVRVPHDGLSHGVEREVTLVEVATEVVERLLRLDGALQHAWRR